MRYNPPQNVVHQCAKELLGSFEEAYQDLSFKVSSSAVSESTLPSTSVYEVESIPTRPTTTIARTVSTMDDESPIPDTCVVSTCLQEGCQIDVGAKEPHTSLPALPKRKSNLPPLLPHTCASCQGRTCNMCKQGCLPHEPALLVCQGYNCGGTKIRKGASYYISRDGNRQYCQRCYSNLPPVLPNTADSDACRYKQDLLKRKNDEEIVEEWLTCRGCCSGVHQICAMHNGYVHCGSDYVCPECYVESDPLYLAPNSESRQGDLYTFVSGSEEPVPMSSFAPNDPAVHTAETLKECAVSSFIQTKVRALIRQAGVSNAEKTVVVRVISDCNRHFMVPDVIRKHFRVATDSDNLVKPPSKVNYQQKAIALFQKMDGMDVCIFCMYVQEYDGNDEYEGEKVASAQSSHTKRVYIAYLDSVEHFRPRECRTQVYHEVLVSYLATARERGYENAQIWSCPPSRGNSFVFWNHPASQRTPTRERLVAWYHAALSRAISCGVVTDVKSLFESDFEIPLEQIEKEADDVNFGEITQGNLCLSGKMICPPLLDGDFWVEEAVRIHANNISRYVKTRTSSDVCFWNVKSPANEYVDPCPALQLGSLIKDRIMAHPSSLHFRKPVNAAALKLKDYHKIVTHPMDLGTIYSRCILGEYRVLRELVDDFELMVSNAQKYNPIGHVVHAQASEISDLFLKELNLLTKCWATADAKDDHFWSNHADMSMSLDMFLDLPSAVSPEKPTTSVVIEDDRSSDGSRSYASVSSVAITSVHEDADLQSNDSVLGCGSSSSSAITTPDKVSRGSHFTVKKGRERVYAKKLDLLKDGPEAVFQSMVGEDTWLLDKKNPTPPKMFAGKKSGAKRRRSSLDSCEESGQKRRKQAWLGEEVGASVRKMRTSFFTCRLSLKHEMTADELQKASCYRSYAESFSRSSHSEFAASSRIADARHTLLEFSQFRHFEFDTLRRAKYSTAMLLYHLHNDDAPGLVPICTSCQQEIHEVRWHKVKKVAEKKRATKFAPIKAHDPEFKAEELCSCCHSKHPDGDDFIPIAVSMKS